MRSSESTSRYRTESINTVPETVCIGAKMMLMMMIEKKIEWKMLEKGVVQVGGSPQLSIKIKVSIPEDCIKSKIFSGSIDDRIAIPSLPLYLSITLLVGQKYILALSKRNNGAVVSLSKLGTSLHTKTEQ